MPSGFGTFETPDGQKGSYFHDSLDCVKGKDHDWSGWRNFWDYCEDPEHENLTDEEHEKVCWENRDNPLCKGPSGGEAVCKHCGMGAMHHSLMSGE